MRLLLLALCLLLLSGCGRTVPAEDFAPAEEDRLVIYTPLKEEVYGPIVKEFEDRTGIWVQVEAGGTGTLLDRIGTEPCDLLFGGGVDSIQSRAGLFEPYDSPLASEAAFRCGDGTWTALSSVPVVLICNPVLVRSNPPESWRSLLDSAWRGKIAFADPSVSGSGYTALAALLQILPGDDRELMAAFARNLDGQILEDSGQVAGAVADGTSYIGVIPEDMALRAVRDGRDVAVLWPVEGTCAVPDGMAVVSGCAHGDNARRFIDFALGEDVQRRLMEQSFRRSVLPELMEEEGFSAFGYDIAWAGRQREALLREWQALSGGGDG